MKGRIIINSHRDIPMLIYIWKWKVVTTASLHHKFFSGFNTKTTYNRLNRLKNHGFLQVRTNLHGGNPVWTLTKKGFLAIRDFLPELKESGFLSENVHHDLLCSALHLGELLLSPSKDVRIVTEQQLRRYHIEDLPSWVPSPEVHRPDGYWRLARGEQNFTVAIELERSRKSTAGIEKLVQFYSPFKKHFRVLWVLEGKGLQNRLSQQIAKDSSSSAIHNMVLLKDFLKSGWQSEILLGPEQGLSIREFIYGKGWENPGNLQGQVIQNVLLNTRLCCRNYFKKTKTPRSLKTATV